VAISSSVEIWLVDGAIQGGDGLSRLLLSLDDGDGVAGNLVLEGIGDLAQGAECVAGVLRCQFPCQCASGSGVPSSPPLVPLAHHVVEPAGGRQSSSSFCFDTQTIPKF